MEFIRKSKRSVAAPKAALWKQIKDKQLANGYSYQKLSVAQMNDILLKKKVKAEPRPINKRVQLINQIKEINPKFKSRKSESVSKLNEKLAKSLSVIRNPINGEPISSKSINAFKSIGYKIMNGKLVYPKEITLIPEIELSDGTSIWPVNENKFKSAMIRYIINNTTEHGHLVNIYDRMSITREINQLIYSNLELGNTIDIISVAGFNDLIKGHRNIGPAYRGAKNCVISALESKLNRNLPEMHEQYKEGVFMNEYEQIAKDLKITLRVNIGNESIKFNAAKKAKVIDIKYLNNHCIATYGGNNDVEVIRHEKLPVDALLSKNLDKIESIILVDTDVLQMTFTNEVHCLSHQSIDGVSLPITGNALTVVSEYKQLFVEKNHIRPITTGMSDAMHFARDGVKWVGDACQGKTLDLIGAYTNFPSFPCYEGIPFDITFWCSYDEADLDVILNNYSGFGYVSNWRNHFTDKIEARWAFIPHIKQRIRLGEKLDIERWGLAFAHGDLDLSMFNNMPKRLWHRVIGSMRRTHVRETTCTTDPILADSMDGHMWKTIDDTEIFICRGEAKQCRSYIHVSAAIQAYSEMMLESKFAELTGVKVWSAYVDGLSTNCNDLSMYVDKWWQEKSNTMNLYKTDGDCSYMPCQLSDMNVGKFVDFDLHGTNRYKVIDGPAGSGKSTLVKKIIDMVPNGLILVPNNNQRKMYDGLNCMTIDMYLTQLVGKSPNHHDFVIIDEYTMMDPNNLCKFKSALMVGNVAQLKIGKFINYKHYDHRLLTKVYRCNEELENAANLAKKGNYAKFKRIGIEDALLKGYTVLAATHDVIENINTIGLKLDIPKRIRFTKTNLKQDIFAGDMGVFDKLCSNDRNGKKYAKVVGRNAKRDEVVYGFARTYHATQGLEFDKIVCCIDKISDWDYLYTGATRCRNLDDVYVCSLRW